jgi:hypothetical protein
MAFHHGLGDKLEQQMSALKSSELLIRIEQYKDLVKYIYLASQDPLLRYEILRKF